MQWHQLGHMQTICTLLQTDNHTNIPSFNFYRPDALPDAQPTASKHCKATDVGHIYKCTPGGVCQYSPLGPRLPSQSQVITGFGSHQYILRDEQRHKCATDMPNLCSHRKCERDFNLFQRIYVTLRVQDQGEDQRGPGKRLFERTVKHVS